MQNRGMNSDTQEKDDTNGAVDVPTTHGQREGSLVRPFMSERQRKNSFPDTRSRGAHGWGAPDRDGRLGKGKSKTGRGEERGRGCKADEEREFFWKPELLVLDVC